MDDTIRTKAVSYTRDHLKEIAAYAIAIASTVVTVSMAYGHKQADNEMLGTKVDSLVTEVQSMRGDVRKLSDKQIEMSVKLDAVDDKVDDFKNWKDRVTGVAETITVPKLGRRARKP